jgi:hypothetical protein
MGTGADRSAALKPISSRWRMPSEWESSPIAFAQRSICCARSAGSRSEFTWRWTAVGRCGFLRTTDFDFATVARRRFSPVHPQDSRGAYRCRSGWQRSQSVLADFSKALPRLMPAAISQAFAYVSSWLPVEGRRTSLITQPLVHLAAVLARFAISPVDAESTYDFIPKYEIIRHMRSPHICTMLAGKQSMWLEQPGTKAPAPRRRARENTEPAQTSKQNMCQAGSSP